MSGRIIEREVYNMAKNSISLHNENGITQLKINGVEIVGVSDYKIASSANGKTELTFTISADNIPTDVEIDLTESQPQSH